MVFTKHMARSFFNRHGYKGVLDYLKEISEESYDSLDGVNLEDKTANVIIDLTNGYTLH